MTVLTHFNVNRNSNAEAAMDSETRQALPRRAGTCIRLAADLLAEVGTPDARKIEDLLRQLVTMAARVKVPSRGSL